MLKKNAGARAFSRHSSCLTPQPYYFIGINSCYVLFRVFQLTSLSANPFQGNSNSTEIKTNPVSLVLKGPEANVISIEGLTSPIDILLPQTESLRVCHNLEYNSKPLILPI